MILRWWWRCNYRHAGFQTERRKWRWTTTILTAQQWLIWTAIAAVMMMKAQSNICTARASNGHEWSSHAPHGNFGRSRRENIIRENPGPKRGMHPTAMRENHSWYLSTKLLTMPFASQISMAVECFISLNVVKEDVRKFDTRCNTRRNRSVRWVQYDSWSIYKAHYRNVHESFSEIHVHPICRVTMSKERFW